MIGRVCIFLFLDRMNLSTGYPPDRALSKLRGTELFQWIKFTADRRPIGEPMRVTTRLESPWNRSKGRLFLTVTHGT